MEQSTQEVSCYSSSLIIDYAQKKGISSVQLFDGIEDYQDTLKNPLEWTYANVWNKLARNFEKANDNKPGILEQAGQEITKNQVSNFQLLFLKIAPISFIANNIPNHFEKNICKIIKVNATIRDGEANVIFKPEIISKYSTQICDFNRGCTFATFKLKGYKNLSIEETSCAARRGDSKCHYKIKWKSPPNIIQRIKNFYFFRFRDQQSIIRHMKESHESLQEQYKEILSMKDFYSHIMNTMVEGILWLDPEGKITYSNKGFSAITGYEENELLEKYFWNFLSDDKLSSEYREIFMHSCTIPFVPKTQEFNIITKDGEKRIGMTSFVWVPSEHRSPGFLISIRDITDQKKVEKKLFASENRYRSLYENSPAIIIGFNPEGYFTYANPAMEEQSGYTEEELKKMHFGQLVAPGADFDARRLLKDLDKGVRLKEVHYKTKVGDWKSIALNTYPMCDDANKVYGIAGIGVDITETKRLNEQLVQTQRMDLLGKMAGGLAHDFNNLLSVIMGFSELISKKSPDGATKKYTDNIKKASERAVGLIRNLLTFSRGEIVKKKIFKLNDLITEIQNLLASPIIPYNIRVYTEIPEKPYFMEGDSGKIHQCILNLCLNAKDAIGEKSGSITIRLIDSLKENFVTIEVDDTGPGIPPDIIENIFDPFFSTKQKRKGTGLGLSVVYGIVRSHGGEINLDSRPGEGATFLIELPTVHYEIKEEETEKEEKEAIPIDVADKSGLIIIVDDDELMRAFCKEAIEKHGYSTIQFSDSKKALNWFKENNDQVFIVLADIVIPQMDGIEMVKHFREIQQDLNVIWMSAYLSPEMKRPSGNDPILKKPFAHTDLIKTINSVSSILK